MSQPPSPPSSSQARAIKVAIAGANGRLGTAVAAILRQESGATLVAATGRGDPPPGAETGAEVVIDVSTPEAAAALAHRCAQEGGPAIVLGVTGLDAAQQALVEAAARRVAVVQSGNFSLGVNLLAALVRRAARTLDAGYDIEIVETHHRRKLDAPSGTALMLGRAAAQGRKVELDAVKATCRDGRTGERPAGEIGFAVMRAGGVVGEHSVVFAAEDEIVTLSHSARDRTLFARGAVQAALWAAGRAPGLYGMADVLGLAED